MTTLKLRNTLPASTIAAAVLVVGSLSVATPASAKESKTQSAVATRTTTTKTADKIDAKALRQRPKLPRKWVWRKYAKRFDSMYRR